MLNIPFGFSAVFLHMSVWRSRGRKWSGWLDDAERVRGRRRRRRSEDERGELYYVLPQLVQTKQLVQPGSCWHPAEASGCRADGSSRGSPVGDWSSTTVSMQTIPASTPEGTCCYTCPQSETDSAGGSRKRRRRWGGGGHAGLGVSPRGCR